MTNKYITTAIPQFTIIGTPINWYNPDQTANVIKELERIYPEYEFVQFLVQDRTEFAIMKLKTI